jgi:hypothetical protein
MDVGSGPGTRPSRRPVLLHDHHTPTNMRTLVFDCRKTLLHKVVCAVAEAEPLLNQSASLKASADRALVATVDVSSPSIASSTLSMFIFRRFDLFPHTF